MHRGHRYFFASVFLSAALVAPAALCAAGMPQDTEHQERRRDNNERHRFYDREHKDYHNWDDNEDQYYRRYLGERHREYRPFERASRREQREYWNWRHSQMEHEHDQH